MNTTEWFIIGSLTMPSNWIAVLLAMAITSGVIWLLHDRKTASKVLDYFILFILVWKLSAILTDFSMIIQQPLALLYFNGGTVGLYLGLLAVWISWFRKNAKDQVSHIIIFQVIGLMISLYSIAMVILNDNVFLAEFITLVMNIGILVGIWFTTRKNMEWMHLVVLASLFFSTIYQPHGVLQTLTYWALISLALSFIIVKMRIKSGGI